MSTASATWLLRSRGPQLGLALVCGLVAVAGPSVARLPAAACLAALLGEVILSAALRAGWWGAAGPVRRLTRWEALSLAAAGFGAVGAFAAWFLGHPALAASGLALAWLGACATEFVATVEGASRDSMWLLPRDPQTGLAPASHTVRVRTQDDIVRAVRRATAEGAVVRPVGSRCGSAVYRVPAASDARFLLLDLSEYGDVLELDVAGRRVHVQAGMQQRHLCELLERHGLALPAINGSGWLTVGGTVATGSVCGSRFLLNDHVLSITVVEADGAVTTVRKGEAAFGAYLCSLGLLGVISSVELGLVESFVITGAVDKIGFDEMLARSTAEGVAAWDYMINDWYPAVDQVVSRQLVRQAPEVALDERRPMPSMTPTESVLGQLLTLVVNRVPAVGMPAIRLFLAFFRPSRVSARWFEMAAVDPHFDFAYHPVEYLELVVPRSGYRAVMADLADLYRARPETIPMVPVITDWLAPDRQAWITKNATDTDEAEPFAVITVSHQHLEARPRSDVFDPVAAIGRAHNARMHWGKFPWLNDAASIAATLPPGAFERFAALRAQRDPEGRFLNGWFRSVFAA